MTDGVRVYSYTPEDKQVIVSPFPKDDQAGASILFLAGKETSSGTSPVAGRSAERLAGKPDALKVVPKGCTNRL